MDSGREIYTYEAPWMIYGLAWSRREEQHLGYRLAVGSFMEEFKNSVHIVQKGESGFNKIGEFAQTYPPTKLMWNPAKGAGTKDLIATSADNLQLWEVSDAAPNGVQLHAQLAQKGDDKGGGAQEYCSPLTSFDWSEADPNIIGTSSIDTTCTIWDVTVGVPRTQLIAHDKEVFDMAFSRDKEVFASVGADGSVRMFDLRSLEHSTIIYETPDLTPLLRLAWNKQDPNYVATIMVDSSKGVVLDIRVPSVPVAELESHMACVNAVAWAPHSSCHICTVGDDAQALIWDTSSAIAKRVQEPILAYNAEAEVNSLQWSASHPEWIAIAFDRKMQILHI
ncbi:WD40-repeat-containing domain protein [Tribonema minus]|uniref:WD40-repeat-containing domain protein n=1 Tax=Tribonema minus TaxID=303371 RepID=A0A835ZHY0_9STRA|nr:WD40-repeat-containing domain protein [Tribonema minus]